MKQTSLFQSWARSGLHKNSPNKSIVPQNVFPDDPDDQLLSNALDSCERVTSSGTTSKYTTDNLLLKLRDRRPISYRATGNDSDNIPGFDLEAGRTWIYPMTNADLREYQFHITEQCLYKNTLVCLPTGLGKTFIAAVVMHNFLRWYPTGKVVFMAPTRPLVAQQLSACLDFGAFASHETIELTGSITQTKRRQLWATHRTFFLTPQVLANDLQGGVCPAVDLRLLVFDEAHKATGNHAYCQVLREITASPHDHRHFRVLALSATPATDVQGVQTVIANLLISHLELRVESSVDVKCYTQNRQLETIVVPLGHELNSFRNQLVECVRVPLERLHFRGAIRQGLGDLRPDRIAKYTVVKARTEWSTNPAATGISSTESGAVQSDFGLVICLLHAIELLDQHGLRPLYQYLSGVLSGQRASGSVRFELSRLPGVDRLMSDLATRFQNNSTEPSVDFNSTQIPFHSGHPKLDKLKQLLVEHFSNSAHKETRVIVFSQFRDSVSDIMHMLKELRPLVRPASFIGQSTHVNRSPVLMTSVSAKLKGTTSNVHSAPNGISQRDQLRVINAFRSGTYNTLVSTCVGEEGLDVGQVDLIVCFDAFKSPIRLIQRLGRTGRQRFGRIVMLLTEGREERNHAISVSRTASIHKALLEDGAYKKLAFYPHNPRMVPLTIQPEVQFSSFENTQLSDSSLSAQTSVKRKSLKKSKEPLNPQRTDRTEAHAMELLTGDLPICFRTTGPSNLVSRNSNLRSTSEYSCLSEIHDVTSAAHLRSASDCIQAQLRSTDRRGPSTSSLHLLSVLRLVRMHKAGVTQLSYHALGLRSVDTNTSMEHLLKDAEDFTDIPTASNESTNRLALMSTSQQLPVTLQSPVEFLEFPKQITGIVTSTQFFHINPDPLHPNLITLVARLDSQLQLTRDMIKSDSLLQIWNEMQTATQLALDNTQVETPPKTNSDYSAAEKLRHSTPVRASPRSNLAAAFHVASPGNRILDSALIPQSESQTQVSFNKALEILNRSSVQLDVSFLLQEPLRNSRTSPEHITPRAAKSVIFSGPPAARCAEAELGIGTNLILSTDFDEDLLLPTQHLVKPNMTTSTERCSSTPPSKRSDSFILPSDISWSPIPLPHENKTEETSAITEQNASPVLMSSSSLTHCCSDKQMVNTEKKRENKRNVIRHSSRSRKHTFLLTQADASTITDSEEEFEHMDTYESSFIDDSHTIMDVTHSQKGAHKSDSSMIGVYLQSIRSPPLKLFKRERQPFPSSSTIQRNTFSNGKNRMLSQFPEQDEYELDSFCVEDATQSQSDSEDESLGHSRKRIYHRRINIDSD